MLDRYLADIAALRDDLADFPRRPLAVVHSVNLFGSTLKDQILGRGDRNLFVYDRAMPVRSDRSVGKVPIGDDAPLPNGVWAMVADVIGDLAPGSGCAFMIDGQLVFGAGPYRPTMRGKRWRPNLLRDENGVT